MEVALTCAYCQQVIHEFKNRPFVDDKLNKLIEFLILYFGLKSALKCNKINTNKVCSFRSISN